MRLSNRAKQILALLLTGTLVSAMAPYNVIGAPVGEEPSQNNQQQGINTLGRISADYATVSAAGVTGIAGVFTKNGDSYTALKKTAAGDQYFSSDRSAELYYKPVLDEDGVYLLYSGSFDEISVRIKLTSESEKTFKFEKTAGSFTDGNGCFLYKLSEGEDGAAYDEYLSGEMDTIEVYSEETLKDTYQGSTREDGKYLCLSGDNAGFEKEIYSKKYKASAASAAALKFADGEMVDDASVTDDPVEFTVTTSSDKAYTGDTLTLSVSEPASLAAFGTRAVTYYVTVDGNDTVIDGSEYTIPQDVSGKTIGFGAKVSYGDEKFFELKTTVDVSDGMPVASDCTAEKTESTGGLDKLLNVLTFGLYANTEVKLGVSVTDPGAASFDSVMINGVQATAEGGKYYVTTGAEYAETGVTVVFMKDDKLVNTVNIREITELTTISAIEIDENYPVIVTDTGPSAVYGGGSGTHKFTPQPGFEIPIATQSGSKNQTPIGLSSFRLDIYEGSEVIDEKKIASFTCDGASVTADADNKYDTLLTTETSSAYSESAVETQDYVLKINKTDMTKALKNGVYTASVSIENNAGNKLENDRFTFEVARNAPEISLDVTGEGNSIDGETGKIYDGKAAVRFSFADNSLDLEKLSTGEYFKYKLDGREVSPKEWTLEDGNFVTAFDVTEEGEHSVEAVFIKDGIGNETTELNSAAAFAVDNTEAKIETVYRSTPTNNLLSALSFGIYRTSEEEISVEITVSDQVAGVNGDSIKVKNEGEDITSEFAFASTDNGHTFTASALLKKDVAYRLTVSANDNLNRSSPTPTQELSPEEMKVGDTVKEIAVTDDKPVVTISGVPTQQVNGGFTAAINAVSDGAGQGADPGLKALDVKVYYSEQKPTAKEDGSYNVDGQTPVASFNDDGTKVSGTADGKFALSRTPDSDADFKQTKVTDCSYALKVVPEIGPENALASGYYIIKVTSTNNSAIDSASNVYVSTDAYSVFEVDLTKPVIDFVFESDPKFVNDDEGRRYFDQKVTLVAEITDNHIDAAFMNANTDKFNYTLTDSNEETYRFSTWEDKNGKTVASVELDNEAFYELVPTNLTDETNNDSDIRDKAISFAIDDTEADVNVSYGQSITEVIAQVLTFGIYRSADADVTITVTDDISGVDASSITVKNGENDITKKFEFTTSDNGRTYTATAALDKNIAYVISVKAHDNIVRTDAESSANTTTIDPAKLTNEEDTSTQTKEVASMEDKDDNQPSITITQPENWSSNSETELEISFTVSSKTARPEGEADPGIRSVKTELLYATSAAEKAAGNWQSLAVYNDNGTGVDTVDGYKLTGIGTHAFSEKKTSDLSYVLQIAENKSGYYKLVVTAENNIIKTADGTSTTYFTTTEEQEFGIDNEEPKLSVVESFEEEEHIVNSVGGDTYYNKARTLKITITEVSFDLDYVKGNFSDIITLGTPKGDDMLKWEQPDTTENVFVGTVTFKDYDEASDGHYTVNIPDFTDLIGNSCKGHDESFTIDETDPVISWKFNDETGVGPDKKYFSGSRKLTVEVEEHNFTLDDIKKTGEGAYLVYSMTNDGEDVEKTARPIFLDWTESGENKFVGTYEFTDSAELLRDGEYTVVITSLTDKAGNQAVDESETVPEYFVNESFIVDNTKPVITWKYNNHDVKFQEREVSYYDQSRLLTVNIIDHNLSIEDLKGKKYLDYTINNEHNEAQVLDWALSGEPNGYTAIIELADKADDQFDGRFEVTFKSLTDRAGNTAENENLTKTEKFIIDTTAPVIKIEYQNDNGKEFVDGDGANSKINEYFNDKDNPLKLQITVTEHNFTASQVERYITYVIDNEQGEAQKLSDWTKQDGKNDFVATYVFLDDESKPNDGDFAVLVESLTDKVGHSALDTSGVEFQPHERNNIVVDFTAPVVTFSYNNYTFSEVENVKYFDKNRKITVNVNDHGIKSIGALNKLAKCYIEGTVNGVWPANNGEPTAVTWSKNGDIYTFSYEFSDNSNDASDGDYKIRFVSFTDPAGNKAVNGNENNKANDPFIDESFVIDTTKPVITITYDPSGTDRNYKEWQYFSTSKIRATISVNEYNFKNSDDGDFNIAEYQIVSITGKVLATEVIKGLANGNRSGWRKKGTNTYETYVDLPGNSRISYFDFTTSDKAGNTDQKKHAKENIVIDDTAPNGMNVEFSKSVLDIIIGVLTFGCYGNTTTVTLTASDETAGIEHLEYECVGMDGSRSISGSVDMKSGNADPQKDVRYSFTVDPQFKGYVVFTAYDFANNHNTYSTAEKQSKGIIVDNKNPLYETVKPELKASPAKTPRNNIYDGDVEINVRSYDPVINGVASGIKEINYSITNPVTGYVQTGRLTNSNTTVNTFNRHFTVDSNRFNSNNVRVRLVATDFAGNKSDPYNLTVNIDITKPTIKVEYQGGQANNVGGNDYYNSDRTAIITVTERNFDPADFEYKIENTIPIGIKSVPTMTSWTHSTNSTDPDASTHVARIVYHEDGYYRFEMSFQDMAGNKATSPAADQFRMDQTKPEISISFDNNSALNDNYYSAPRTATITIKELNFSWDEVRYNLSATAADNVTSVPGPQLTNMSDSGDVHTAKVLFNEDGMFSFTVDNTDFATNVADRKSESTFYLDQVIPELVITGVNNDVAYGGEVSINIAISDINYGGDYDYKLERVDVNTTRTDVTKTIGFVNSSDGTNISLSAIPETIENDGIYILSASARDKAGNLHPETVRFSVNRFGSSYLLDDSTAEINNLCINEERDVVVMEFNADPIIKDELLVTVGGSTKTLTEGTDYTVDISGDAETWYKAVYTINKDVFSEEGIYKVLVKSKDNKLNSTNSNNDIDRSKEKQDEKLVVSFIVDKQSPMVSISGIEAYKYYREDTKTLTITLQDSNLFDNFSDNKITVTVDGQAYDVTEDQIKKTDSGYVITLNLSGNGDKSTIVVEVTDRAGNVGRAEIKEFTLNATEFQMFLSNTVAVVLTIIGLILLIIAIIIIVVVASRRKKKKNQS